MLAFPKIPGGIGTLLLDVFVPVDVVFELVIPELELVDVANLGPLAALDVKLPIGTEMPLRVFCEASVGTACTRAVCTMEGIIKSRALS